LGSITLVQMYTSSDGNTSFVTNMSWFEQRDYEIKTHIPFHRTAQLYTSIKKDIVFTDFILSDRE